MCVIGEEAEMNLTTAVTKENRSNYDFTEKALEYLTAIGENYPDRSGAEDGTDDAHDAFGNWLMEELVRCGYDPAQIEEQAYGQNESRDDVQPFPAERPCMGMGGHDGIVVQLVQNHFVACIA